MNKLYKYFLLSVFTVFSFVLQAQFRSGSYWKQTRNEFVGGAGASNFLGELGGKDAIGKDMSPRDLEISETKYVINVGWRYYVQKNMCIKTSLYYGMVSGDDALTKEPFRNGRNLSFKSPVYEISALYEYHLIGEKQGRMYKVRGTKGGLHFFIGVYPFVGIGAFYYNPKAYYNGQWHSLRQLSTEGQGIKPGTKPYSSISYCIPMGIGFRYSLNQQSGLGLELGFRKTFTDYIDDVSTEYYDKNEIQQVKGDVAAALSNRSLDTSPAASKPGDQRGDPTEKDSYMFIVLSYHYKISKKRGFRRIKSRRSLPSF